MTGCDNKLQLGAAAAVTPILSRLPRINVGTVWDELDPCVDVMCCNKCGSHRRVQIDARRAGVNLAEEQKKPGWALDLGYGYRDGTLPSGDPRSDFVSLSVSFELPFFQKNRQDRKLSAALSERGAAEYKKDLLLREMSSQLDAAFAHWTDLTRRVGLYESRILSLSEDQAQAALLAYQSEAGDFADVMRGYIDDLNTRLEHVRLQVDRGQSYAVLANLGGIPQ